MASTSETGHAKNAANFEDLISFCTGYGVTYNPSKVAIKLPGLTTLSTNANAALQAVKVAKTAYDNTTNAREVAFKVRVQPEVLPAALLLDRQQALDGRAGHHHQCDALFDIERFAVPGGHQRRTHGARLLPLWPVHVAVDRQRLLVAK